MLLLLCMNFQLANQVCDSNRGCSVIQIQANAWCEIYISDTCIRSLYSEKMKVEIKLNYNILYLYKSRLYCVGNYDGNANRQGVPERGWVGLAAFRPQTLNFYDLIIYERKRPKLCGFSFWHWVMYLGIFWCDVHETLCYHVNQT